MTSRLHSCWMSPQGQGREPKLFVQSGIFLLLSRPKTQHPDMALKLIDQGLNVARLNFSHGDHEEHLGQMMGVQSALRNRPNHHVSTLLDTKGP